MTALLALMAAERQRDLRRAAAGVGPRDPTPRRPRAVGAGRRPWRSGARASGRAASTAE